MKKLLLIVAVGMSTYIDAQRQIIVVDRNQPAEKKKEVKKSDDYFSDRFVQLNNVFKFDPLRMIIGDVAVSYERVIGEKTSLEVEAGPTFSNLGLNRLNLQGESNQFSRSSDIGGFASLAIRFYPLDGRPALNQFYISPKYKFRQYNESINAGSGSALSAASGYSKQHIFSFNFGMQHWVAKRFALDYYVGIGIGQFNDRSATLISVYNGNEWKETWEERNTKDAKVVLSIGVKCGFGK